MSAVVALLVLGVVYTLFSINNAERSEAAKKINPQEIQENYTENAVWGKYYPRHWESYQKGLLSNSNTKYAGNTRKSKLETYPYLKTLYAGLGYSEEFREPRGHPYALEDLKSVPGSRRKTGGACLTCKGPEVPGLIDKYGNRFYSAPFDEMVQHVNNTVGCSDCHDPKTNDLRITRPALINAFKEQGKDVTKATKQEMRSLVCAQCHVTYYFKKGTKETTFPWGEGLKVDQAYNYYQKQNYSEWEHPIVKTGLVKARHPDYEYFQGSTHQSAGVACADCHMPYVVQGDSKISSHWWVSPLLTMSESCSNCHTRSAEELKERVYHIQDQHAQILDIAAKTNMKAVEEIKKALATPGADQALIKQAQATYRKAFWYFDWISTTNSMGFHNPQEAANVLGQSIQFANEAIQDAQAAVLKK